MGSMLQATEQAAQAKAQLVWVADGAIVGSALVRRLESIAVDGEDRAVVLDRAGEWLDGLVEAAHS